MTTVGARDERVDASQAAAPQSLGRGRRWQHRVVLAVMIIAVAIAAAGLLRAATAPADVTGQAQVDQIAASLRCPTCQGLSVADSPSQLAQGMRDIITRQIDEGRSPAEVRDWFTARYGPWILLEPPTTGPSALVWVLPVAAIALGVALAWRRIRRTTPTPSPEDGDAVSRRHGPAWAAVSAAFAVALAGALVANVAARGDGDVATGTVPGASRTADAPPPLEALRQATVDQPDDPQAWLALAAALDRRGDLDAALAPYERAFDVAGDDPTVQIAVASALVRADRPADAEPVLRDLAERFPDEPEVFLLLGTAERELGRFTADATLRRFLEVAPEHPAADTVRSLLEQDSNP